MNKQQLLEYANYSGIPSILKNKTKQESVITYNRRSGGNKDGKVMGITGIESKYYQGTGKMELSKVATTAWLKYAKVIVHGGEKTGIDQLAENFAIANNIPTEIHRPFDYKTNGGRCYLVRNTAIVKRCDVMFGGLAPGSRGTTYTLCTAMDLGVRTFMWKVNESPIMIRLDNE